MNVLLLGGTADARKLARKLLDAGVPFQSSLAGRVSAPRMPVGPVRIGGFGGVAGLADYLAESGTTHVIDATHPFAAQISANARAACAATGVALLRLSRPGWGERTDSGTWHWADDLEQAREMAGALGDRPFLTTGRQSLPVFAEWRDRDVLVRTVEEVPGLPSRWTLICDRGPYSLDGELAAMRSHLVNVLVTKDSGGPAAKLDACAELGVPVVIVRRPDEGAAETVPSVAAAMEWIVRDSE